VNYYTRHIGDYLKDTAHLSLLEHGVYTRLLDVYYTRESGIPEIQVARLIGARTEPETQALQVVLQEFFELRDGVWRQGRCDEEISRYADSEPEREVKKANEDNRLKRHREERARMFKIITDAGEHAPWNTSMQDLRAMVQRISATPPATAPETDVPPLPATAPATPATATQYPLPNTHPQEGIPVSGAKAPSSADKLPPCQGKAIVDLYHQILPELPSVQVLDSKPRQAALRKTWAWVLTSVKSDGERRATNAAEALEWFRAYFERARENDFLMGKTPRSGPHANWRCDLDFLLTDRGMKHVIEKTQGHA